MRTEVTVATTLPPRGANGDPPFGDEESQVEGTLRARRHRRLQVDPAGAAVEHGQLRPEAVTGCELCWLLQGVSSGSGMGFDDIDLGCSAILPRQKLPTVLANQMRHL